ncbi:ATP-binding protein [Streptomyces katsurahamanus]|uniref:ATP-binding protein n=1 Tax=Streptomyces katsurahamanus TaxID=2577098 RepID=A0ABW9NTC9_9ACTN|nr:ATP-binding protein [Streptomyces katsurahamanus]MQS36319.1 ATP-binding protein [Streptomyces katsurahamanus]
MSFSESFSDTVETSWQFPRTPRTAGSARSLLREQLAVWRITGDAVDAAELLLSELVANAIRHANVPGGDELGVRLAYGDGMLRVEVSDTDSRRPEPRVAGADDEGGRGLFLVSALSERWGCDPRRHGAGKTVWVELKTR